MLTAHARRADADDAVIRAEMALTRLQQARDRLAAHVLVLENRRSIVEARRRARERRRG